MKNIGKKIIACSMLGLMQVGILSSVAAAAQAPLHNGSSQQIISLDRDNRRDDARRKEHDERQKREKERHEKEMKRRPHEGEREWRERQQREKERHEQAMREIAALLIGIAIGSSNN